MYSIGYHPPPPSPRAREVEYQVWRERVSAARASYVSSRADCLAAENF